MLDPLDLIGTVGAAPTITLLVTNHVDAEATLAGWIDYNRNGVFEDSERATASIVGVDTSSGTGTSDQRVTLTFPAIPSGSAGNTYARFRLSTDSSLVANPSSVGAVSDGEVEDYQFSITAPGSGLPRSTVEINSNTTNGLTLSDGDSFGSSVTSLGDLGVCPDTSFDLVFPG